MVLYIFESFGTQELIFIGIIALVVFGPRKMPEMAKKFGSMMSEFRKVTGDFKSTWENAVDLEKLDEPVKFEKESTINKTNQIEDSITKKKGITTDKEAELPEVRKVSKAEFDELVTENKKENSQETIDRIDDENTTSTKSEKTSWL